MIRAGALAAILIVITHAARSFHPGDGAVFGSGSLLAAGFLLLTSIQVGHVFERIRLPHLTGFLLCGLATGPQGLHLVSESMLQDLGLIKNVAIGLIALLAGSSLDLRALAPRLRTIGAVTAMSGLAAAVALFVTLYGSMMLVTATAGLGWGERALIAAAGAIALSAASPPVVIGVLSELRAKGPLSELWVPLVVLNNLVVVIAFSFLSPQLAAAFPADAAAEASSSLTWQIFGSLGLGLGVGAVLALYAARVREALGLFTFALLFVVAEAGRPLQLDPMLVGLAAGLLLENVSRQAGQDVGRAAAAASLPTFALFFAVVGAEIHLDVFLRVAPFAVALAAARAVGLTAGTRAAVRLSGLPDPHRELLAYGLLPQAGIALALATSFGATYPRWGEAVGAMMVGTVVVNELIGPALFRVMAVRSGEAGQGSAVEIPVAEAEWQEETFPSDLHVVDFPR
jgi:Kef-type K+ transport system membrane component KefB